MNSSQQQPRTSLREQLHCIQPQHTHSPCTATCTTHPATPSQLPSTTMLCTQLTNTKHIYSWQNGTRCRDGVNVLWYRFHLVWLVFEGSIPTCACFHSENFFVTFSSKLSVVCDCVVVRPNPLAKSAAMVHQQETCNCDVTELCSLIGAHTVYSLHGHGIVRCVARPFSISPKGVWA